MFRESFFNLWENEHICSKLINNEIEGEIFAKPPPPILIL